MVAIFNAFLKGITLKESLEHSITKLAKKNQCLPYSTRDDLTLFRSLFSARCNIYISHLCYDVGVRLSVLCLSVTEVHWRIIANLRFKFRSKFTAHCGRSPQCSACGLAVDEGALRSRCMPGTQRLRQQAKLKPSYDPQQTWLRTWLPPM